MERELLPEHDPAAADRRAAEWNSSLKPCNAWESWLVDRIATEALRVERLTRQESLLRALAARRARLCWDEDRKLEAEELGAGLARNPTRIKPQLERTSQGCAWLIARWTELLRSNVTSGQWTPAQASRAMDLLGIAPELRSESAAALGNAPLQVERARGEIARLTLLRSKVLLPIEVDERNLAEVGMGREADRAVADVRRYESACLRRLEWAWSQLKKGRHDYRPGVGLAAPSFTSMRYDSAPTVAGPRATETATDPWSATFPAPTDRPAIEPEFAAWFAQGHDSPCEGRAEPSGWQAPEAFPDGSMPPEHANPT